MNKVMLSPLTAHLTAGLADGVVRTALWEYRHRRQGHDEEPIVDLQNILIEMGLVEEREVARVLADLLEQPILRADLVNIEESCCSRIPLDQAYALGILPVRMIGTCVWVAMLEPRNILSLDCVRHWFPECAEIIPILCAPSDLRRLLDRLEDARALILQEIEALETASHHNHLDPESENVLNLISGLLLEAFQVGASDIHFEPTAWYVRLRYRIDGMLETFHMIHSVLWPFIRVRLKLMAQLDIGDGRRPQSGRFCHAARPVGVEYRLSTHPIILADRRWDENIALRVLDKESHMLSIEQLGFDHETRDALKQLAQIPFGITVITGPTGSGKTTTLYAILQLLNQQRLNIMTLEDPIEYYIPSIRQTEICPSLNLDYAQGIRSLLRQNPDVILIGEIRDAESAEMAMRAAITGHRVLTTMHTKDTFGVVQRFINLGMDLDQLRGNLAGIVNQRLLRRVCKQCQTLHTDHGIETPLQSRMMSGQGCSACRYTGYRGRFALAEIVTFSAQMRDALLVDPSQWQQRVAELGMKSLHAKALEALANEVTTACEITRVCGESR